jgi:hypothetical protein
MNNHSPNTTKKIFSIAQTNIFPTTMPPKMSLNFPSPMKTRTRNKDQHPAAAFIPKPRRSHAEMELIRKQEAEKKKIALEEKQKALKRVAEIEDTLRHEDIARNAKLHSSAAKATEDSDAIKKSRPKDVRGGRKELQVAEKMDTYPEIQEDRKLSISIKHFLSSPTDQRHDEVEDVQLSDNDMNTELEQDGNHLIIYLGIKVLTGFVSSTY